MKIYVYAICKNESAFVERWVTSMREADGICVLDTGSTDDSVERLRALGVKVYRTEIVPWRFDEARNRSLELVPEDADLCVCTDLDEVFHPGWRAAMEAAWTPEVGQLRYRYTWNFDDDGNEGTVFWIEKAHARHGYRWVYPVHEVLRTDAPRPIVNAPGVQLDHHADSSKSRAQYLPLLELAVEEDPQNDRNMHYLGREYWFRDRPEDAIRTLKRHLALPSATWADERAASMRYLSAANASLGRDNEAERWLFRAVAEAPHLREPWLDLALLLLNRNDFDGAAFAANRALAITDRATTYLTDTEAWGARPFDILSVALYHTDRLPAALTAVEQAHALDPCDARIAENLDLIRNRLT